ncbi:hypothetical protein DY000_02008131 [Brassica cretica]|uniref:Uncharacterized protein n=1 Tax=Brassica cretica TaxID=69181 RepID=A0ABQ7BWS0_BRACR|nr:hypothetical protein DY000_02008131 [Brassica cretica]
MDELVVRSIQIGHPPNWSGPARRMAELVVRSVQLGGWPSWSCVRSISADGQAGRTFSPARPSVDLDLIDSYWTARGEVKPPLPVLWGHSPFKTNLVAGCPSRSCPNGLAATRRFYRIPESVEFRLQEGGEVAQSPPEGYFTCYEAYLMQCHLWFPTRSLSYSFSTVSTCRSAKLIHAVYSTSLGSWSSSSLSVLAMPRWKRAPSSSLGLCPPLSIWLPKDCSPFESYYADVHAFGRTFPRSGSIMLSRSIVPGFSLTCRPKKGRSLVWIGLFHIQTKRDKSKPRKDNHLMLDEDVVDGQLSPDNILKDYLDSQAGGSSGEQFNLDGLFEFDFPPTEGGSNEVPDFSKAARMVIGGLLMTNRALDTSKQDARMARFKVEVADQEIACLKDELESSRRRERESFEREVNHVYRRGKREIVEVVKSRRDKFSQKFGELNGRYKALADYRECRGTVGGLYVTQLPEYTFTNKYAKQTGNMAEKNKDLKISEVEEEIWEQWEPVPVSPDMVEAETGDPSEAGEVDQPVAPLDVNDYSIGRWISGNFDLGDKLQGSL